MKDDATITDKKPRLRFSLGSMLLMMAVVCLSISLVIVYGRLMRIERELNASRPLSAEEVARQFETSTKFSTFSTKVQDVRYSPKEDSFLVSFSWDDPTTKTSWSTEVRLKPDGYGRYFGQIRSGEFLKSVGSTNDVYTVVVESPSPWRSNE